MVGGGREDTSSPYRQKHPRSENFDPRNNNYNFQLQMPRKGANDEADKLSDISIGLITSKYQSVAQEMTLDQQIHELKKATAAFDIENITMFYFGIMTTYQKSPEVLLFQAERSEAQKAMDLWLCAISHMEIQTLLPPAHVYF